MVENLYVVTSIEADEQKYCREISVHNQDAHFATVCKFFLFVSPVSCLSDGKCVERKSQGYLLFYMQFAEMSELGMKLVIIQL